MLPERIMWVSQKVAQKNGDSLMLNCTAVLLIILLPHLLRGSVSPHCYFCLIFSVGTDLLQSSLLQSGFKDTLIYLIPSFLSEPSNSFW